MITLQNDTLTAVISPKGAELQSLLHVNGQEYMWNGNPAFWGKHSPVLFPIVGTLKNDTYIYKNTTYQLPRHGFARDRVFTVEQLGPTEVVFVLTHDDDTLAVYPFPFTLQLRYVLEGSQLHCSYEVINTGSEEIWFSVGGHPAFAVPLKAGENYTDYYLEFEKQEPLVRYKLKDGLIGDETETIATNGSKLKLEADLFYADAIVLKHLESQHVTLANTANEHGLHFSFEGFPFLGIWAAKDAPFVCIEPWCGIADNYQHNQQLTDKEGINSLEAGGTWKRTWSVSCF